MGVDPQQPSRRQVLKTLGVLGTVTAADGIAHGESTASPADFSEELRQYVARTTLADTHEHLPDEDERLTVQGVPCDDWAVLVFHYLLSDLVSAGMPGGNFRKFTSPEVDPLSKWSLIAPYWPAVKNSGYGKAVRLTIDALYGIEDLNEQTIPRLQQAYEALRQPGFYRKILVDMARIESCQVHYRGAPFKESRLPTLLTHDLCMFGMHIGPDVKTYNKPVGRDIRDLSDWHAVIRWWFDKYGPYAVAVKNHAAYVRGLDYVQVPAEQAAPVFKKHLQRQPLSPAERKLLEDHLFWYVVAQATAQQLPVKIHTGYLAGNDGQLSLKRTACNPFEAAELCRQSPQTQFVFMHIGFPFWQELITVAKRYRNAHIDMCWAWILDPAASVQFLKSYLMSAPANKVFVFGGDYRPVECVLGHALLARRGIACALLELVNEGWLNRADALALVEPLMHGNARRVFHLESKLARLRTAPWAGPLP